MTQLFDFTRAGAPKEKPVTNADGSVPVESSLPAGSESDPVFVVSSAPQFVATGMIDPVTCAPLLAKLECVGGVLVEPFPIGYINELGVFTMSTSTPYLPKAVLTESVKVEARNFFIVDPLAGTVGDFVNEVIAVRAPEIQLPNEAAAVPVTAADVCGWTLDVLPCGSELETGEVVPDGADFAFIGGLKSTGDADAPVAGVDLSTTFTPAPTAGSIIAFCVSFERKGIVGSSAAMVAELLAPSVVQDLAANVAATIVPGVTCSSGTPTCSVVSFSGAVSSVVENGDCTFDVTPLEFASPRAVNEVADLPLGDGAALHLAPMVGLYGGMITLTASVAGVAQFDAGLDIRRDNAILPDGRYIRSGASNAISPDDHVEHVFAFAEVVEGLTFDMGGVNNFDAVEVTAFLNGVEIPITDFTLTPSAPASMTVLAPNVIQGDATGVPANPSEPTSIVSASIPGPVDSVIVRTYKGTGIAGGYSTTFQNFGWDGEGDYSIEYQAECDGLTETGTISGAVLS